MSGWNGMTLGHVLYRSPLRGKGLFVPFRAQQTQRATTTNMSVLFGIVVISGFDRLSVAPMLASMARDLSTSVGIVTIAVTAHFLAYGVFQLGHGWLSDRIGRQRALRVALAIVGLANLIAALAPDVGVLIAARAVVGAASGGLVPGALVVLADQPDHGRRSGRQAALISALGAGTALSVIAGCTTAVGAWRIVLAATALASLLLSAPLGGAGAAAPSATPRVWSVINRPAVFAIALVAIPEGAAVFGFIEFFPLALQHAGTTTSVSALSTAAIGIGMIAGGLTTRRLTGRIDDRALIGVGAGVLAAGYVLALALHPATLLVGASLIGIGQSALHATLQRWATEAAPDARGVSTALFATGTFGGAGLASIVGSAAPTGFVVMFAVAAASTVISGAAATSSRIMRRRSVVRLTEGTAVTGTGERELTVLGRETPV